MYHYVDSAGLNFVSFSSPKENSKIDIESLKLGADQKEDILKLNIRDQHAIAEIVDGSINGHQFYVSKKKDSSAELHDDLVPYIFGSPVGLRESLEKTGTETQLFRAECSYEKTLFHLEFPLTKPLRHVLEYLFQSNNYTLAEISTLISEAHGVREEDVKQDFKRFYASASKQNMVLLTNKTVGTRNTAPEKALKLFLCS